jgi:hypothetical protein
VLADVVLVLDQFVLQRLLEVGHHHVLTHLHLLR